MVASPRLLAGNITVHGRDFGAEEGRHDIQGFIQNFVAVDSGVLATR